jgi:hypothetical protein
MRGGIKEDESKMRGEVKGIRREERRKNSTNSMLMKT